MFTDSNYKSEFLCNLLALTMFEDEREYKTLAFFALSSRFARLAESHCDSLRSHQTWNWPFQNPQQVCVCKYNYTVFKLRNKKRHALRLFFHSVFMDDFLASGRGEGDQFPQLEFEQLPFNHPLFIMYSSGTTGAPKCMVHSAGVRNTMACTCSELKVFSLNTQIHSIFHTHKHKHTADNFI